MKKQYLFLMFLFLYSSCGQIEFENMDRYPFIKANEDYSLILENSNLKPLQIVTLTVEENVLYKEYFLGYVGGIETKFIRVNDHQLAFEIPEDIQIGENNIELGLFTKIKNISVSISPTSDSSENLDIFLNNFTDEEYVVTDENEFLMELYNELKITVENMGPAQRRLFNKSFNANFSEMNNTFFPQGRLNLTLTDCETLALESAAWRLGMIASVGALTYSLYTANLPLGLVSLAILYKTKNMVEKKMKAAYDCSTLIELNFGVSNGKVENNIRNFNHGQISEIPISGTLESIYKNTSDPILQNLVRVWEQINITVADITGQIKYFADKLGLSKYEIVKNTPLPVPSQPILTTINLIEAIIVKTEINQPNKVQVKESSFSNGSLKLSFVSDRIENYDFTFTVTLQSYGKQFTLSSPAKLFRGGGYFSIKNETMNLINGGSCPPGFTVTVTVDNKQVQTISPGQTSEKIFLENGKYVWNVTGGLLNGEVSFTINNNNYNSSVLSSASSCGGRIDGKISEISTNK